MIQYLTCTCNSPDKNMTLINIVIENLENIWKTFGNDLKIWQKDLEILQKFGKKLEIWGKVLNLEKIENKLEI